MELINRENILRYIADLQLTTTPMTDAYESLQAVWNCVAAAVDYSGEYVRAVRCRDCRYWQDNNGGYPHNECRWGKDETPYEDDFCSYGKRR